MKYFFPLLFLFAIIETKAQTTQINLEDLWLNYRYRPETIDDLRSMNDGEHYTIQKGDAVLRYAYETGKLIDTVFTVGMTNGILSSFDTYTFNDDETAIMLGTRTEARYRHATFQYNYIYDRKLKTTVALTASGKQMYAHFAPAGNRVAYVMNNNLFFTDLSSRKETQVTFDGEWNKIINGGSDWVYEEEFELIRAFEWSPDGKKLAYYRFDESEVPEFTMPFYEDGVYPRDYTFKYPKVGEKNSTISIWIYDIASGKKVEAPTGNAEYVPRIKWIDNNHLCVFSLNRLQNQLVLSNVDASTGISSGLMMEDAEHYLEINNDLTFLPDGNGFIWKSERDGFYHLYHMDMQGKVVRQITSGPWDVIEFKGYDAASKKLYYLAAELSPLSHQLYSIQLDGKKKTLLSPAEGTSVVNFSTGFKYFINGHSTIARPAIYSLHKGDGQLIRVLEDNAELIKKLDQLEINDPEFFQFTTSEQVLLNGYMIRPPYFDASKKYPVLMFNYGGPGSQRVMDAYGANINSTGWAYQYIWFQMMAQKGYLVVCVDNRGTAGRGRDFRTVTYENLGKYETMDQIEAAKWLGQQPYVDASRIGIFGWSYGGYMSALCITKGAEYFKAAISVAPVSNWKYYDNVYTERFMGTLESNPDGYDANSPVSFTDLLEGDLLLVHGSGDDNVHLQNSMELINALIKSNKHFDLMIYPNRNHGIYGGNTRYHLFNEMTDFLLEKL